MFPLAHRQLVPVFPNEFRGPAAPGRVPASLGFRAKGQAKTLQGRKFILDQFDTWICLGADVTLFFVFFWAHISIPPKEIRWLSGGMHPRVPDYTVRHARTQPRLGARLDESLHEELRKLISGHDICTHACLAHSFSNRSGGVPPRWA